ncbi:Cache 3/Cache 2 fusion domain-containing protein [Desulfobacterales bacterium HSG16]|nr:Cache 3/Cache 2 fusion domain-containing protein [Desulfobacterales bacterium HSG16]
MFNWINNMKLRRKLLSFGLVLAIFPALIVGVVSFYQYDNTVKEAKKENQKLASNDLEHIVEGVYAMVKSQQEILEKYLKAAMNAARSSANRMGRFSLEDEIVSWNAKNQFDNTYRTADLPKMTLGEQWLGQISDSREPAILVDDVQKLAGGSITCTVFQRMNSAGDMLRVATNVIAKDGSRAIGTFIPAINTNGKDNPVVSKVLRRQTFQGRAFVVNAWYITLYEPIYDINSKIIGMLYVGVPQESTKSLRKAIIDTKVGTTGYVYVIDSKANYIISKGGDRDGDYIGDSRDADGNNFIKDIIDNARGLSVGSIWTTNYAWKNPGDIQSRVKVAKVMYFAPWDWIIGAGSYIDEFEEGINNIQKQGNQAYMILIFMGVIILFIATAIWFWLSGTIAKPVVEIAEIINNVAITHDLTKEVPVRGSDEIGSMAKEFNGMMKQLRESFDVVASAAVEVESNAGEVFRRATANQQRATEEEKQVQLIQKTVSDMGVTAKEVAGHSGQQKESADRSTTLIQNLVNDMKVVSEASYSQVEEANVATERVGVMGETGAKVVATANKQGEAVERVNNAVNAITKSVEEMTNAAIQSGEHGKNVLEAADEGTISVNATVEGMKSIAESSEQISEIISVITDIAEQTNLLALNAAIEAARAGSHGKGFAVVADEVGKLAQRSSEAAKEITQLIKDSTARVSEGTRLTDQSQESLKRIAEGGKVNMNAIEGISETTNILAEETEAVRKLMEELNIYAREIGGMAGKQGERRQAAQTALASLVDKSHDIETLVTSADEMVKNIGDEMKGIAERTDNMQDLTNTQAGRSKKLREITDQSIEGSRKTVEGAGEVAGISQNLQNLSKELTTQMEKFKH